MGLRKKFFYSNVSIIKVNDIFWDFHIYAIKLKKSKEMRGGGVAVGKGRGKEEHGSGCKLPLVFWFFGWI